MHTIPSLRNAALRRWHFCAICAVTLLGSASIAGADDPDRRVAEFLDANRDHHIAYEEFVRSAAAKALREMDADGNGSLSRAEAASSGARQLAGIPSVGFADADTNGDGQLSLEELKRALHGHPDLTEAFMKLDRNGDGVLSPSESSEKDRGALHAVPQIRIRVPF